MLAPFYACPRPHIPILVREVGKGEDFISGDGSTQISPNHSFDVQVVGLAVEDQRVDEDVPKGVDARSLHLPNQPG